MGRHGTPIEGRCHCGNLSFSLETGLALEALPLRACACSFCARHGARTTTDPEGRVRITARDPARLRRYRFGLATADFLVCADCGVYLAAVMDEGERAWATLNANTIDGLPGSRQDVPVVSYEGESEGGRRARRRARWTPAALDLGTAAGNAREET